MTRRDECRREGAARYELDGSATVIADSHNGKRLNSPNDVVSHPDGSIWFTDPPYGGQLYEGEPDAADGSSNAGRAAGYSGVTVWTPPGKLIGRIRLPEVTAYLCFGGPNRSRLFMAASQSLYGVYANTQGAAPE